jgi:polar amino acid transport system substrate-binding protein
MSTRSTIRRGALLATVTLVGAGLGACSTSTKGPGEVVAAIQARQQAGAEAVTPATGAPAAAPANCTPGADASFPALASLPSPSSLPPGSLEATIRNRGYLVVGVSGDTRLLGARNRLTDADPRGFDIDVAKAVGRAIFGTDDKVRFKTITAGQRFTQVNDGVEGDKGGVDLVARAVSMTCDRWANADRSKASAFSVAYLRSAQLTLARKEYADLDALAKDSRGGKARICAPNGSTSLAKIPKQENLVPVAVAIHSDCLALWQEGRVDAITGDDVILAGFRDQDPSLQFVKGKELDNTPYGLAISKDHPKFVQFVNAVMATPQFRQDWQAAYDKHLNAAIGIPAKQFPPPNYGRALSP